MYILDESATHSKEVFEVVPNLTYVETACLLSAAAEALKLGQTLADTIEERNIDIEGITDGGCCLLPHLTDVRNDINLISLITFCIAQLMQTDKWL